MLFADQFREVSEWFKELAWKASIWVTVSRVRIPSSLQNNTDYLVSIKLKTQFYFQKSRIGFFYEFIFYRRERKDFYQKR